MNRLLHKTISLLLLAAALIPLHANASTYFNNGNDAFNACIADGALAKICPTNIHYCFQYWPGSAGYGLQTWTSVEQNNGCGLAAGTTYYYHIFPTTPLPSGMSLVGPTSADIVSQQAVTLAAQNEKQLGGGSNGAACTLYGNPCDAAIGNKVQPEVDFTGPAGVPTFLRTYNSQNLADVGYLGYSWTFDYSVRIIPETGGVVVREPNAKTVHCTANLDGSFTCPADVRFKLEKDGDGYKRTWQDGRIERYNAPGNILEKFSPTGLRTHYDINSGGGVLAEYGPGGHKLVPGWGLYGLSEIWQPDGNVISFNYDSHSNLIQVNYPDGTNRRYLYEDPLNTHALTGILDETGQRVGTYAYDASTGQTASTQKPDGSQFFGFSFGGQGTTVTDAAGNSETLSFNRNQGINNLTSRTNNTDGKVFSQTFDANNNLVSKTDEEGRTTTYTWDAVNRLTRRVEASGTSAERVTTWAYLDAFLALPTVIEEPSVFGGATKRTEIAYDAQNRPFQVTVSGFTTAGAAVSRVVSFTYAPAGQIGSITDGNGHVTQFAYPDCSTGYGCQLLSSVTNALGQATTFDQYDANGRLLKKTEPNGLATTYTYDLRGRVLTVTETPATGAARTTSFTYDAAGKMLTATLPGRGTLTYAYDVAGRVSTVTDALGNQVVYGYDSRGNRIQELTKDPNGTLVRQVDAAFDARNYPNQVNAAGSITQLVHDAVGNLTHVTDPNGNPTTHQVDALDRLVHTADAIGGMTDRGYDTGGNLDSVTTPNSATTTYEVDDLGNEVKESSPDRGITTYTHDANGNEHSRTDARGITATFTYDALNRVTGVSYPNASENITYAYDACAGGIGRLCSVTDANGTRSWSYDGFGRIVSETWSHNGQNQTTSYTWTAGDDLASITYQSGRTVAYTRDAIGRLTAVASNGSMILTGRTSCADGLVKSQTLGNGLAETKAYDLQGRLTTWQVGTILTRTFAYDANGNQIQKDSSSFQYDPLDRLIGEPSQILAYDGNSNRLSDSSGPYTYTPASNRMATGPPGSVVLDAAGNTLSIGSRTFGYNQAGRLVSATVSGQTATYTYRHDGLRASKTVGGVTTFFHYDLNGRLIAETDAVGATLREYVWDDSVPVAQIEAGVTTYLHTDQLGTPRLGTNSAGAQVWAWDSDAFGKTQSTGSITINLRFPGQYFDEETGLHQNGQRTFDPSSGRYLESDPIGFAGGVNTFGYANGNPVSNIDPTGEFGIVGAIVGAGIEVSLQAYKNYRNGCDVFYAGNYDWWDVGVSAAVGALGPGWLSVGKTSWRSGNAIKILSGQLDRARTVNRAVKIERRIAAHQSEITDVLITQGAFQGAKAIGKAADGNGGCTCRR